ncbi:hypothetical protein BST81_14000 [Leptolyngbya sp. 'hensonii']|uniref:PhoX family protein n=1 Tax=Leptolyngbya sp. 'hensonii' TaxID=1922337 RepID=UPI00094F7564|nr:alkaline phosphatase PhoX [Leptolyngbya sp. 'hensonii']OLP18127.1 hypothetical protein BST81_14000 [Leptolyngbya sp. 'hensonii']
MSNLSRRQLLMFFGASAGAAAIAPEVGEALLGLGSTAAEAAAPLAFTALYLPSPLPIHKVLRSYQPTGGFNTDGSPKFALKTPSANPKPASYAVVDDVVVPPEYDRYVIVGWGDKVFANTPYAKASDYFGYNCDYTGYVPVASSADDVYLWVNHEYVSFPIAGSAPGAVASVQTLPGTYEPVIGKPLPATRNTELDGEFLYNTGGSIVRITRTAANGRFVVNGNKAGNWRVHGLSGLGLNATRPGGFPSNWGAADYQQGDDRYLIGTGPAVKDVFEKVNTDSLGNKIIGTSFNCSGGTTPWYTIMSAEENFQGGGAFFSGVTEGIKKDGSQAGYTAGTTGERFGQVGEKYGWMVEIDPANPSWRVRKHSALGRFRHENITMRVEAGKKLVAYMGDDRRGGHTWKYVSKGVVADPTSKANSALLEDGTLYVAKFNENGTGEWIPLTLDTPTNPVSPGVISQIAYDAFPQFRTGAVPAASSAQQRLVNGLVNLPRRAGVAGQTAEGGFLAVTRLNEATILPAYQGKKLSDFYDNLGAILCDAYPAANLVGGTPTARPEDLEVSPLDPRQVFIAYTDGAPGSDGYPDARIFQVAKFSASVNATQQPGGLYRITEDSADSTGTTFQWIKYNQGGEAGSQGASGFAAVDNLAFDPLGNIWGVTDMSTGLHNGFQEGTSGTPLTINHTAIGDVSNFVGVFGNNWMFYVPTSGPNAGQVTPFAYGPVRCEMTGPTFVGNTLIVSVQHPGEDCPIDDGTVLTRTTEMLALDGTLFNQTRSVNRGSSWPGNLPDAAFSAGTNNFKGALPRPTVIGIRRKTGNRFI